MAYSGVYRSQSQSSNSSISSIDGIGIKINDRLVPPPRVTIPPEYTPGNPSEILFMEYDFSFEEHVLKWSQSERENEQAIRQAATERVASTIQTFSQEAQHAGPAASNTVSAEGTWNGPDRPAQTSAPNPSPFMNLSSDILTPMPIGPGHMRKESGGSKAQTGLFDLKDFENEQDPFENMELKVLNDREELNKMVFAVQPLPGSETGQNGDGGSAGGSSCELPPARPSPPCTPVNLQDVDYPEVESLDSGQYPLQQPAAPYAAPQPQVRLQADSRQAYYQPPQPVSTTLSYSNHNVGQENTFPYNQNMPLPPIPKSHYLASSGATYMSANSSAVATSAAGGVVGQSGSESVSLTSAAVTYTPQLADKSYLPYQNYYSRHSVNNNTSNGHLFVQQEAGQLACAPDRQTPPMNPLRSARSTPDISGSEERRLPPLLPSSHTPPPTARPRSPNDSVGGGSPPARPSVYQAKQEEDMNWNHYNILPSTPRSSTNTPTSPKSVPNAKAQLPNPFEGLSHDAQRYVENVTDMGFQRARVARAVHKLGSDDKKVIDHLCMVNRLTEQGCAGDDAETALFKFDDNIEKAEQYLKLLSQFKEIGFVEESIQEALVSTNLDENKTLDLLMAS